MASALHGCRACQRRVLDAFTSCAGISLPSQRILIHPQLYRASRKPVQSQRTIHSAAVRWQPARLRDSDIKSLDELVPDEPEAKDAEAAPTEVLSTTASTTGTAQSVTSSDPHIPWYLRVEPPTPLSPSNTSSLSADLPPLPVDPPAILSPLLTHLSVSIGLDHLTILDLRDLSPPSPLGANLLMILGTARSEKHLNTSADRFCRWLRSTYRLRPYADGLLGRNELKLKLRRRNRKMKLAQSVGNTMYDSKSYDDGITTGWICCNLGAVDVAEIPEERSSPGDPAEGDMSAAAQGVHKDLHPVYSAKDQERILEDEDEYKNPSPDSVQEPDFKYRGFGSVSNSPRIVVQMFTEEKRLEMDLEGLWESRIRRRDAKEETRQRRFEEEQENEFETSRIEEEIESPEARKSTREERIVGGIGAS